MLIGNNNPTIGTKVWDDSVQRKFPLNGSERFPLAQDENGTGGKYYADPEGIASYIGSASSYTALIPITLTSTGTQTYVGTGNPTQTSYSTTKLYVVPINFTNTNASATLSFDGLGARGIFKLVAGVKTALVAGDLTSTQTYVFYYDGADFIIFNGKINTFYDNNGNLMIIGLNSDLYFPVPFDAQTTTDNASFFIRDGNTRKLTGIPLQLSTRYVDANNGSDSSGNRSNPIIPYQTITRANQDAPDGSLVVVYNGSYNNEPALVFKNNVIYYLTGGVLIASGTNVENATNIFITGYATLNQTFKQTNSTIHIEAYKIQNFADVIDLNSCTVYIKSNTILRLSLGQTTGVIRLTDCTFSIYANLIQATTGGDCRVVTIIGGSGIIQADTIKGESANTTASLVDISGACGDVYLKANEIYATDGTSILKTHTNAINVTNSSGTVYIDVNTVYGGIILAPTNTGRVVLRINNKIIANLSNGDTLTMGANCSFTGIAKNEATTGNATALRLTASNACVKDVVLQGGHDSARGNSAVNLIVAGTLSTEVAKNANVTIIGGTYTQNSNFSNL